MITNSIVANKLQQYFNQIVSREELISWCENMVQEETFDRNQTQEIVARIGLMDAQNFEVSFEELMELLHALGYKMKVELVH
ncbi:MAG: hypothetical protein HY960_12695 [Ignavibacteriae bacterium]|nr:hypothetical protein [Ignavibacteriota bacterium]